MKRETKIYEIKPGGLIAIGVLILAITVGNKYGAYEGWIIISWSMIISGIIVLIWKSIKKIYEK